MLYNEYWSDIRKINLFMVLYDYVRLIGKL